MSRPVRPGDWTGIHRHGAGWRAVVSRGRGAAPVTRHFPQETPAAVMQEWRADERARQRIDRKQRASQGTFEGDARLYLRSVSAMASHSARTRDIERWIRIFGTRRRDTITAAEIRTWRDRWMTEPRGLAKDGKTPLPPYAAMTINHRLRALSNLWTVLDGRRALNPVREVPEVTEPDPLPRDLPFEVIDDILNRVTKRGRPIKGQPNKGTESLTFVRLRVIMYTGLTYSQLARLQPEDVDLVDGSMLVRRRSKGKGAKPQRLPLHPEAVKAFESFVRLGCWGPFSGASVRKTFVLAAGKARKAGVAVPKGAKPYDLRHSWGTAVVAATGSKEAARQLLSHAKRQTTERYILGAVDALLRAQVNAVPGRTRSSE
jgi:integrase